MRRGFPAQITCDCEGAFISSFNTALTDLAGICVHPTSSYNPMSCSQAENIHPRCTDMLRCLSNPEEPDCAEWVLEAHFAHKHCEAAHHAYLFVLPRVWTQPCTPVNILAGVFMPSVAAEDEAELAHRFRMMTRACDLSARLEGRAGCAYAGGATGAHAEQGRAPSLCASRSKVGGASPRPPSVVTVQRAAQGRSALLDDTHNPRARPGIGAQSSKSVRARLAATCRKPLIWKTQPPSRRDKA